MDEELPEPLGSSLCSFSLILSSLVVLIIFSLWGQYLGEELPEPLGFSSLLLSSCCFWLSYSFGG
nr:hypothetical protein [Mycoplasmopsis bovis]